MKKKALEEELEDLEGKLLRAEKLLSGMHAILLLDPSIQIHILPPAAPALYQLTAQHQLLPKPCLLKTECALGVKHLCCSFKCDQIVPLSHCRPQKVHSQ